MRDTFELKEAIKIRTAMEKYQDTVYLNLIRQLNNNCQAILCEDLGSEFVRNCGRDIAGEIVRNCFDTSSYNLTVNQLAKRILEFSYESEYDPLADNGGIEGISKTVLNYNEFNSKELEKIASIMDASQEQLFTEHRATDKHASKGLREYRKSKVDENGDIYDELNGQKGAKKTIIRNGKEETKSELQADHCQARETAKYNTKYLKKEGGEELKLFWNSADNMQIIYESANASKGDIRVCKVNGKIKYMNARSSEYDSNADITHKATPEQLADAIVKQWESIDEIRNKKFDSKIQKLKDKGYLDESGKVPKSVQKELINNIRYSQNIESKIILKVTDYTQVSKDAVDNTKGAIGKVIAGQVLYYAAPPLIYELRTILKEKTIKLETALEKLGAAAKRICEYVLLKIKPLFMNIAFSSLKKFIKSFMDILINIVKATVKKILKMAKNLVLATVDAVRIISNRNSSSSEKANAVFNLYGVTITSCVIEVLFELAADALHIPNPFDDIIFGPLQILVTVICINLTLVILKKLDLFDLQYGFKMSQIRQLFKETREAYETEYELSTSYADAEIAKIIEGAKQESLMIFKNLEEYNLKKQSVRDELEKINSILSMKIDFEDEWLKFLGIT